MITKNPRGHFAKIVLCLMALFWLAGCAGTLTGNWNWFPPSAVKQDFGNSVRNDLAQTVVNPGAGKEATPAAGLEPTAATNALGSYEKTFKEGQKGAPMKITQY